MYIFPSYCPQRIPLNATKDDSEFWIGRLWKTTPTVGLCLHAFTLPSHLQNYEGRASGRVLDNAHKFPCLLCKTIPNHCSLVWLGPDDLRSSSANIGDMKNIFPPQSWVLIIHGAYLRRKSLEPPSPLHGLSCSAHRRRSFPMWAKRAFSPLLRYIIRSYSCLSVKTILTIKLKFSLK